MANKLVAPPIDDLIEMWGNDCKIDKTEPGTEMLRIPILHNKYNKFLTLHNLAVRKADIEISKMRKLKWRYYAGKMEKDELDSYGWEQFYETKLKQETGVYIEGDADLAQLEKKKAYHQEAANFCQNVMKELNNRTWQLKEYMAWERFIQGQH
jgi:hypothetical protein